MSTGAPTQELELIALSHDVNVEYLSSTYTEIRELLGSGLGGTALEAVSESEAAVASREFLEDCVGVLPKVDDNKRFNVATQSDVRWLQNSVIWIDFPHYIIGEATEGSTTRLLLHKAASSGSLFGRYDDPSISLVTAEMRTKKYQKLRGPSQARLQKREPLSPEEMNRLFDRKTGRYSLGGPYKPDDVMNASWLPQGLDPVEWAVRMFDGGPGIKWQTDVSEAVYGQTLANLKVANRLSYLALAFGKEAAMSNLLEKHLPDRADEE